MLYIINHVHQTGKLCCENIEFSRDCNVEFAPTSDYGWHHDCNITWVQEQFPDDASFLLLNDENEEMVFGNLMTMKMNKVKSKGQRLRKALLPIIYYFYIS